MNLPKWAAPVAAVFFVLLVAIVYRDAGRREEAARQSLVALNESKDSLKAMKDTVGQLRIDLSAAHGRVDTIRLRSNATVAKADSWGKIADSIRNSVNVIGRIPDDTGVVCKAILDAYNARTSECAQLRLAVSQKDSAIQVGQHALEVANTSLTGFQRQIADLQHLQGIVVKPYECRWLFFPCPSRTMTFVLGALGGAVAARAIH